MRTVAKLLKRTTGIACYYEHIPRSQNALADHLGRLARTLEREVDL